MSERLVFERANNGIRASVICGDVSVNQVFFPDDVDRDVLFWELAGELATWVYGSPPENVFGVIVENAMRSAKKVIPEPLSQPLPGDNIKEAGK